MTSAPSFVLVTTTLVAALSLAACGGTITGPSQAPAAPIASVDLETNAVFRLRSIAGADGAVLTIGDPSLFTLMLNDGGRLSVRADCNRGSGGYRISGNTLAVGPMATTRAYCASAPVDQQFLTLLGGENAITTSGTTLQLSSPRGTLSFGR